MANAKPEGNKKLLIEALIESDKFPEKFFFDFVSRGRVDPARFPRLVIN
jgi:hypothetical protein